MKDNVAGSIRKNKFIKEDEVYFNYIESLESANPPLKDLLYQFPSYVGYVSLARFLTFYECYKQIVNVSGHIADIGTWKGASLLSMAKLGILLEPHSNTEFYGFDWFKGSNSQIDDNHEITKYKGEKEYLEQLIEKQGMSDRVYINELDLVNELDSYFDNNPWLRYKLVFMDCGIKNVLNSALPRFWDRLTTGGILILDHYNHPSSPSESIITDSIIGDRIVHQLPFSRSPTAYIVK